MNSTSRNISKLLQRFKYPIKSYKKKLQKHPIIIQSIQTGCLYGASDLIAQTFIEQKCWEDFNVKRTVIFFTTGTIFTGPLVSMWYILLGKKIGVTGTLVVAKKVVIDQFLFVPFFHVGLLTTINTLHGHDWNFIKEQIRTKYFDILSTSLKLWPAVQLINFSFVTVNYQLLFGQSIALFWNVYISWKTQYNIDKHNVVGGRVKFKTIK